MPLHSYTTFCIHLSIDRYLGYFYFSVIMTNEWFYENSYKFLCGHIFSILSGIFLEMELLGHLVIL